MGDEAQTDGARFSVKMATALAAEIKQVIATENLHVICNERTGEVVPLIYAVDERNLNAAEVLSFGWHLDAEKRIAEVINKAVAAMVRDASPLEFMSSDAMMLELKKRSDLFFCVMTPNTQEDWEWRRSFKGAHAYPLIGFVKMNLDALSMKWAQDDEMLPRDGDEDSEDESDDEGSPGHEG